MDNTNHPEPDATPKKTFLNANPAFAEAITIIAARTADGSPERDVFSAVPEKATKA